MALWDKKANSYGGKPYTIHWDDKTTTILSDSDMSDEPKCACCSSGINGFEYVQYHGFCRSCFAVNTFCIPGTLEAGDFDFLWRRPVEVTSDWTPGRSFSHFGDTQFRGADKDGYNFGIGDVVLHKPSEKKPLTRREGKVIALHEYTKKGDFDYSNPRYLAKVFFGENRNLLLPAGDLEVLTCKAITFDTKEFDGKLENMKFKGEVPISLKKILDNPKARAIYLSYRMNHLVDQTHREIIEDQSLEIAYEFEQARMPRDRAHMWFMKRFRETNLEMGNAQVAALLPYLFGEKEAKYALTPAA